MKKIKILFFIGGFSTGGKERQLGELIKGLSKEEYSINLVVKNIDVDFIDSVRNEISIHILNVNHFNFVAFIKLVKIIKNIKPDIVHSWFSIGTIFLLPIQIFYRFYLIDGSIRDAFIPSGVQKVFRTIINYFTKIIVSNSQAGLISYKVPFVKGRVIHNGFDFSRIKILENKEIIKTKWNISTKYIVGMVARINGHKDYFTYINAANIILKSRYDVSFLIVGGGEDEKIIKAAIIPDFKNYFIFTKNQNNIENIINIFDIGILSSNCEGLSNSIMEYMALSKPVIATDAGGTSELVVDGDTGFLFNKGDEFQLADKISFLLNNNVERERMGENGYNRIKTYYNFQKMINAYRTLYNEIN